MSKRNRGRCLSHVDYGIESVDVAGLALAVADKELDDDAMEVAIVLLREFYRSEAGLELSREELLASLERVTAIPEARAGLAAMSERFRSGMGR